MSKYEVLKIEELDRIPVEEGLEWRPIRRSLGIRAFGMNAYTAEKVGDIVVEEHNEGTGHEEVYVVVSGLARFTVDGDDFDAPAGTIVFLPDPQVVRAARSQEEGTTVLAVGGWPGKAFEPSGWEGRFRRSPFRTRGATRRRSRSCRTALDQFGESGAGLYHVARYEARAGRTDDAAAHIARALELNPEFREYAEKDDDLAPLLDSD